MGTGEIGTPTKAAKDSAAVAAPPAPTAASSGPTYPEWAAAFQAYYNSGGQPPPGYFPPSVASGPQPHPYMWGGSMLPPYGTPPPPPYGAMYPHGGMYAHPSMPQGAHPYTQYGMPSPGGPEATAPQAAGTEAEVKTEGKEKNLLKRSKGSLGSLGMGSGKGSESAKGNSANEVFSQSGESGSDGSSDGSEEDSTPNMPRKRNYDQMTMEGVGVGGSSMPAYNSQPGGSYVSPGVPAAGTTSGQPVAPPHLVGKPAPGGPTTSLGIGMGGMDYWSGSATGMAAGKNKRNPGNSAGAIVSGTPGTPLMGPNRDGVPAELWLQDEREVKRQRRKQSNRESARRSRLRKQAECEELGTRVDTLTMENVALRSEINHLNEECNKLKAENAAILEQLNKLRGGDEAPPKEQPLKNDEGSISQGEGNGKVSEGTKSGSPRPGSGGQKSSGRREDESFESSGKFSSLDAGSRPEAVAAG